MGGKSGVVGESVQRRGMVVVYGGGEGPKPNAGTMSTWISRSSLLSRPPIMDYLRTLGSAAVSSIVQKSGLNLPFSLGKKLSPLDTLAIWTLYDATKRVKWYFCSTFLSAKYNLRMMDHLCLSSSLTIRNGATCFRSHRMPLEGYALRDILTFSNSWTQSRPTERYT